jgi:glycosyltransferase involved in cell wall biosynthesis
VVRAECQWAGGVGQSDGVRIAIVGTELCAVDRRGGGLEQVLRRWADWLAAHHEVVVVSHGDPQPGADPYDTVAVPHREDLDAVLAGLAPDVVSLHNRPQWGPRCPPGASVAVTFHNYPAAWKTSRRSLPAATPASAVSAALASAAAARLSLTDVTVTPPSIDPAFVDAPPRSPRPVVLAPNRLMAKKGIRQLLEVAGRPEFATVTFAFADVISPWRRPTGEHRALRSEIGATANAELFPPAPDPPALARRYASAGAVACPAQEPEGLGLVALEAQACRVPLVTTDVGGLREATFSPNWCVPPGDLDALASALAEALRSTGSAGARDRVLDRFSPEASGRAFEAWLLG